jgi:predicted esterase
VTSGPHQNAPVYGAGEPLNEATSAMVLLHGRGATAEGILTLSSELNRPGWTYLAPQAAGETWYPYSFLSPLDRNEPWLSSALGAVGALIERVEAAGVPADHIVLLGFSQGGCLASEYVARNARRYGGLAGLSAGLIGPPDTSRDYPGGFGGMPVFLGCSTNDPHIPEPRVHETGAVLSRLGAEVVTRIYPGIGHTIVADEIREVQAIMDKVQA